MSNKSYTWTELNEMNVETMRSLVVGLGQENPEFVGMSKKQKPFLIQALWNYFMSTGQASFEDASDAIDASDESIFNDIDNEDAYPDFTDDDNPDEWTDPDDGDVELPNGMAEVMGNPAKKDSKLIDTEINHVIFSGMISNGPNVSNITVTISSGSMSNNYPVVGKTIYEIEKLLGQVLNVNPYARIVLVNGEEVTNDYIVGEDDVIEFVNEAYDKG
jgi:hypothetical protein